MDSPAREPRTFAIALHSLSPLNRTSRPTMNDLKIFSGRANASLARRICDYLGLPLGAISMGNFPDGEISCKIDEDVRGRDVFLVQPTCPPVNDNLMELLIMIESCKRASAERITAVVPYYGYARQDRKDEGRVPITAKLVANIITRAGADRVLTMDLHAPQIQGFFDVPVDHLYGAPVLNEYFVKKHFDDDSVVVVSPDEGSTKRALGHAKRLNSRLAIVDKRRSSAEKTRQENIIGASVEGKIALMFDDMISTAGSICGAAVKVHEAGAREIYVASTHGVLCGKAIENLSNAPIKEVVLTDTIPLAPEKTLPKFTVLSVAPLLGEAIKRIHRNESVSRLFV
jgi:ribose-phosphate pyrophosphokinase